MKIQRLTLTISMVVLQLALCACVKNTPPSAAKDAIAIVNGKPLDRATFEIYAKMVARKPLSELNDEQQNQILDQFIAMQLATELAVKDGLDKSADVSEQLALARMNTLSEAVVKRYLDAHPVTDAEVKAEYDTQVATMGRQYHARHILVESKAVADDLIVKLLKGEDFAKLAQKESKDPSASQGGDLGWFALSSMVPEFGRAIVGLDKGKFTNEPVHTQYGWHIIKLEDYRTPEPPAFDSVQDQVKALVQRKKLQAYMADLRKGAKVEKHDVKAKADTTANGTTKK